MTPPSSALSHRAVFWLLTLLLVVSTLAIFAERAG